MKARLWTWCAGAELFRAILTAEIVRTLVRDELTVRAAHDRTAVAAAGIQEIKPTC